MLTNQLLAKADFAMAYRTHIKLMLGVDNQQAKSPTSYATDVSTSRKTNDEMISLPDPSVTSTSLDVDTPVRKSRLLAKHYQPLIDPVITSDEEGVISANVLKPFRSAQKKWLSNQKPSLSPNKWKNDPKPKVFSNPPRFCECDPVARFGIFNLFLDDVVIGYVVEMTDLYAQRENSVISFTTYANEIVAFFAICLTLDQ